VPKSTHPEYCPKSPNFPARLVSTVPFFKDGRSTHHPEAAKSTVEDTRTALPHSSNEVSSLTQLDPPRPLPPSSAGVEAQGTVASNALLANPQADNGFGDAIRKGYLVEEAARRGNTGGSVDRDRMKGRKMGDSRTLTLQHSFLLVVSG
jgi:hypothetical protein